MRAQRILVTGGAGFIGSYLTERLLSEGHRVTVIDDFSTGSRENLTAVSRHPHLRVEAVKVSACAQLDRFLGDHDQVYHLAAAVGVELVVRAPIQTVLTNLRETEVLLEAAAVHRVPVLITSTSEVYGKSQKNEFAEDDDLLIGPPHLARWSYACSKLMDEFLALAYVREGRLEVTVARLFNTVGPRQTGRYGMVLPRFIAAARAGNPLRVFGDGQQTRCFCDVRDTVEALVRLQNTPAARGQVFNVGSDEEVSIADLARRVIRHLNSHSTVEFVPYAQAYAPGFEDMIRRRPCLRKLERVTGFRPGTSLDHIIARATEAFEAA